MTDLRTAAQQALETLEDIFGANKVDVGAINALRAALAEPVQEPVAWMDREGDLYKMPEIEGWAPPHTMLYAAPPQRKPLSDEDAAALIALDHRILTEFGDAPSGAAMELIRAVERAHGIT